MSAKFPRGGGAGPFFISKSINLKLDESKIFTQVQKFLMIKCYMSKKY